MRLPLKILAMVDSPDVQTITFVAPEDAWSALGDFVAQGEWE